MINFDNPELGDILNNQEGFRKHLGKTNYLSEYEPFFVPAIILPGVMETTSKEGRIYLIGNLDVIHRERHPDYPSHGDVNTHQFDFFMNDEVFGLTGLSKVKEVSNSGYPVGAEITFESIKLAEDYLDEEGISVFGETGPHKPLITKLWYVTDLKSHQ